MTFSLAWDLCHAQGKSAPDNARYANFEKILDIFVTEARRMLELGTGNGSSIPYFAMRDFGYHGIEGSESAVQRVRQRYALGDCVKAADFTKEIPFAGEFDLVVDRAAVPHNDLASIKNCIGLVYKALKPGGLFVSSDWFSTKHSEYKRGHQSGDPWTKDGYEDGQFAGVGKVHFSSQDEVIDLFKDFEGVFLQERVARRPAPNALVQSPVNFRFISQSFRLNEYRSAFWDIVVRKPA